jgi:hypothetical protein
MHLIVYSPLLTSRIKYIFNFIFKDILKTEVEFTGNKDYFLQSENAKISYADQPLGDELYFKNSSLLLSNKVEEIGLKTTMFGDYIVPFPVQQSALPFDVFAASFFLISRYEEYLHQQKSDQDFKAKSSYQTKWRILNRPIIDEWALILKNMIRKKYPTLHFQSKKFLNQPIINFTLKPDVPLKLFPKTKFIISAVFNKEQRYLSNVFDNLTGLGLNEEKVIKQLDQALHKTKAVYFISFPKDTKNKLKYSKTSEILKGKAIGLLRPCTSDKDQSTLVNGLNNLKKINGDIVNLMSQQLEVLRLPTCYLQILSAGITSDYSMGYADTFGFRAGTCTPFCWYDLQLEKITPILVKSYCINDSTLQYLNITEAKKVIEDYIGAVKLVDGDFYSSWQLKSLSENVKFKKWKTVFNDMLKYAGN